MLKKAITLIAFFWATTLSAQDYAYSFEGTLSLEQINQLKNDVAKVEGIDSFKLKIKEEHQSGILLLVLTSEKKGEDVHPFDPSELKALLIRHQLHPLQFKHLKPTK